MNNNAVNEHEMRRVEDAAERACYSLVGAKHPERYIIGKPHPDRARQFKPFAALKGYEDLIDSIEDSECEPFNQPSVATSETGSTARAGANKKTM